MSDVGCRIYIYICMYIFICVCVCTSSHLKSLRAGGHGRVGAGRNMDEARRNQRSESVVRFAFSPSCAFPSALISASL
jgi:hypothetical protein